MTIIMTTKYQEVPCIDISLANLPGCPAPFRLVQQLCILFSPLPMNWNDSREFCLNNNGRLIEIENEDKMNIINNEIGKGDFAAVWGFWLGLTDKANEGQWRWTESGKSLAYSNWLSGQPDNYGRKQHCALIYISHENDIIYNWTKGKWDDENCNVVPNYHGKSINALCEKI